MALDSAAKRASAVQVGKGYVVTLPFPDTSVDDGDRYHVGRAYSGITPAAGPSFLACWVPYISNVVISMQE